jgi:hypothetical protein
MLSVAVIALQYYDITSCGRNTLAWVCMPACVWRADRTVSSDAMVNNRQHRLPQDKQHNSIAAILCNWCSHGAGLKLNWLHSTRLNTPSINVTIQLHALSHSRTLDIILPIVTAIPSLLLLFHITDHHALDTDHHALDSSQYQPFH